MIILTDDQRWDQIDRMPLLQRAIVDKGVTFSNAFVVNSLCCPSRATLLTGRYSHGTGIYKNEPPDGGFQEFDDASTLATWLDSAGYRTALLGKYFNHFSGPYVPPGWDRWAVFADDAPPGGSYYDYTLSVDGSLIDFGSEERDYSTDVLGRRAAKFIQGTPQDDPLFLLFSSYAPHSLPVVAVRHRGTLEDLAPLRPPNHDERNVSDKPAYIRALPRLSAQREARLDTIRLQEYRSLLAVDDAIDRIVGALRSTDRLSNTFILFTSDNGLSKGEHRWQFKLLPYEENIRVPFVVRYDPMTAPGTQRAQIVGNIDVASTIVDLAGTSAPSADGRSLLPLIADDSIAWRSDLLVEHVEYRVRNPDAPTYCAVRSEATLFVRYATGEEELYDLVDDPYQLRNRAGAAAWQDELTEMRERTRTLCSPLPPGMPQF